MRAGDTFAERQRARAERDAMIRDWQRKSDATYRRDAVQSPLRRVIEAYRRSPLRLAEDAAGVILIFGLAWIGLVITGGN